ncbi:putative hydrolases of HD superfamily [Fodinibius roseus]|uniref:5'-deoxynucleotidase n=1 Tax=Fodinibius roseus TaxID=1194090 RepID=A0A1M4SIK5_9BACT|nr:HD domain-containing protein [Fodinibius roseus]SHE32104.1 putative hydrolases of HD superfamily [Fodinibius roseus]
MNSSEIIDILDFLRDAEQLKNTLRSSYTSTGRVESVAEHSWRLCLMAMTFEQAFPEVDMCRVIKIGLVHDLGEAINGDIPAPQQSASTDKSAAERRDLLQLLRPLSESLRSEILELWDEYEQASTPEARTAKALDKLETIIQHNQGDNPPDFDYAFNLEYGQEYTSDHPVISDIRRILDQDTEDLAKRTNNGEP